MLHLRREDEASLIMSCACFVKLGNRELASIH